MEVRRTDAALDEVSFIDKFMHIYKEICFYVHTHTHLQCPQWTRPRISAQVSSECKQGTQGLFYQQTHLRSAVRDRERQGRRGETNVSSEHCIIMETGAASALHINWP